MLVWPGCFGSPVCTSSLGGCPQQWEMDNGQDRRDRNFEPHNSSTWLYRSISSLSSITSTDTQPYTVHAMSNHVSLFDIPHIMEGIGLNLNHRDRASCRLISRSFGHHFGRLFWRNLVIQGPLDWEEESKDDPEFTEALCENAYLTRNLTIQTDCHSGLLSTVASSHKQLQSLTSHICCTEEESDNSSLAILKTAGNNQGLLTWSFISEVSLSTDVSIQLPLLLKTSRLQVLDLKLSDRLSYGWLKYLLTSLPLTLKSISLSSRGSRMIGDGEQSMDLEWPRTYPKMEAAVISVELGAAGEEVLVHFLERCTELRSLSYPKIDNNIGPTNTIALLAGRLSKLANLSLDWAGDVEEPQWLDIVMAMKGRIKSFATDVGFDTSPPTLIPLMVSHWHDTLETLRFNWFSSITARDLNLILTTCSNLKVLDCMWTVSHHDGSRESDKDNWICLKLEELRLMITDCQGIHLEDTARSMQLSRARERIEHMYRQLGRLTKLRELTLGWNTMDPSSDAINLNMTLQQGLGHLAGLTTLRVLDVAHLPRVKIGLEEVKWMAGNWKMLRKIHGLRYRHRTPRRNATVPSYVRWLLSNRPCISIS